MKEDNKTMENNKETTKETTRQSLHGEVIAANLNDPMTWEHLQKLSEVSQADYIRGLRKRFGCGVGQMAELFGCKKQDLILKAELLGIDLSGARPAKDPNKIYAWAQFTGKIPPDGCVTRIEANEEGDEIPDTQDAQEIPEKRGVTVKALKLAFTGTLDRALMELEVYADVLAGETVTVTVELEEV